MQISGNYYVLTLLLFAHMGIAVRFFVGYRTSIVTVRNFLLLSRGMLDETKATFSQCSDLLLHIVVENRFFRSF